MSSILIGAARHDSFGPDAEPNPPHRQTRQAARSQRRKGGPVVCSDCIGQAEFAKDTLEDLPHGLRNRALQRLAAKKVPTESIGDGERVASLASNRKVSLEVRAPD